jgi:uncharacterized membrane protein
MHVHELHAAAIHAPMVLLPAAAAVDLSAAITGDRRSDALGRKLWWLALGAGALAGVAGLAASQEVKTDDRDTEDMMWRHGAANFTILLGGLGVALYRSFKRPSLPQALVGLAAAGVSFYTAYLGGEMVYGQGVGVRAVPEFAPNGIRRSPPVLSRSAPGTFVRDAVAGLSWLVRRTAVSVNKRHDLETLAH